MQVIHAREAFPERWTKSLFLAGPTPRDKATPSWRPEALRFLEAAGYDGVVLHPEDRGINGCAITPEQYEPQIRWEHEALQRADVILFWVPRDLKEMPAFTTNIEWGEHYASGKVVLGYPPNTPKMGYFATKARWHGLPVASTLQDSIALALAMIGDGALRLGAEMQVPIDIWRTPMFQSWHAAQAKAGNTLLSARVLWRYRIGHERERLFFWALETDMHVRAENRIFRNGVVLGRPDVAGTVLFGPDRGFNTEVALIREFRPSARTSDGYVHEPANGSSWKDLAPAELAAAEAVEETGVQIGVHRLQGLGERQLLPTLCPHRAAAYFARLSASELASLKKHLGRPQGVERDGERTWIEIYTVREILEMKPETHNLDWSTLGMILYAFYAKV